jgi:hypothetical protein
VVIAGFSGRGLLAAPKRHRDCNHESSPWLPDEQPSFQVGDRVVAANNLRGRVRPYVRRGTRGLVIVRTVEGHYVVEFSTGRTCIAEHGQLAPLGRYRSL